ncbi:response regulator [Bradyrhizobium sp. GCM10027634]|uniref:response regulator n=1 Tax=unclassified Bradyrhizobium TaxID=2631580 RepID=UPI00188D6C5D|nr:MULTISPECIES: response regulator [unclassified Bradyrhizobium]MDN5004223.1 response regulator [Bradyrhizobium sp. WYCCWR 12677]QOZ46890.1 response regulator [Bradyrhizobium sp. CCBAU 53340]
MIETGSHTRRLPMAAPARPVVYVVDDDDAVLGSLRFLLETDGFAVRTFRSATALLNATSSSRADCYVIDYKMPGINGIDLAGRLRQFDADTPVILITGYPDGNISARAAAAGIKEVILKPLLDENLLKRIRSAIQDRPR